jgi:nicotinate-nucleotide adenylyltransferase
MTACRQLLSTPKVVVTGFEADLGTPYTAATLDYLRHRYPTVRFVWIMGADNLAGFHRWQRWHDIASHVPIAVVDRPKWRMRAMASPAARAMARAFVPETAASDLAQRPAPAWTLLSGPLSALSSTLLRGRDGR